MGKLFGTDGIRGIANADLSCELALKVARASAQVLMSHLNKKPLVIIGTDTRISCDMLSDAMASGFCSAGADVLKLGVIPTPAIAYLVTYYKADIGVMISASHNPAKYNGIKLFDSKGYKLPDAIEEEIEACIFGGQITGNEIVGSVRFENAADIYVDYLMSKVKNINLPDMKIIVDCANGAASVTAEKLFSKAGVDFKVINNTPDGLNINKKCGSTNIDAVISEVKRQNADLGISFDGDADRCLMVDKDGNLLDGDILIAALAIWLKNKNKLKNNKIAVTQMSNMGFLKLMRENGIDHTATRVGDRYVLEAMLSENLSIGGEQSGHIILLDNNTTGDGQMTALSFLEMLSSEKKNPSEIYKLVKLYPQISVGINADNDMKALLMSDETFNKELNRQREILGEEGRIIVRPSGTEPVIRLMVEGENKEKVEKIAGDLCILAEKILAKD